MYNKIGSKIKVKTIKDINTGRNTKETIVSIKNIIRKTIGVMCFFPFDWFSISGFNCFSILCLDIN